MTLSTALQSLRKGILCTAITVTAQAVFSKETTITPVATPGGNVWSLKDPITSTQAEQSKRLRDAINGHLTKLNGNPSGAHWRVRHENATYRVSTLTAWVEPRAGGYRLWIAEGGPRIAGGYSSEGGLLRLMVLGVNALYHVEEESRSTWIVEGKNGRTPDVVGLLRVGADRYAFATVIGGVSQGYGTSIYFLRAPQGSGFKLIGTLTHHDGQAAVSPSWFETLELRSNSDPRRADCWPISAVTVREIGDRVTRRLPPVSSTIRCNKEGEFGDVEI